MSKNGAAQKDSTPTNMGTAMPTSTPAGGSSGGHKAATLQAPKTKHAEALPGMCCAQGCKGKSARFNFCSEHYEHFKFGLIKKTGEPVSDYEKKIEHFLAHQAKAKATGSARKAA